ncbi:TPA: transposase, partial [Providencia rettgeri]|nr:transposase [Providencia rettgeri]
AQRLQDKGRQEGLQQGIEQGIEKGRQEGMREAKIMMARNLLKNGVSLDLIIESTGLSREELISLQ